jgi:hypothetical protein
VWQPHVGRNGIEDDVALGPIAEMRAIVGEYAKRGLQDLEVVKVCAVGSPGKGICQAVSAKVAPFLVIPAKDEIGEIVCGRSSFAMLAYIYVSVILDLKISIPKFGVLNV